MDRIIKWATIKINQIWSCVNANRLLLPLLEADDEDEDEDDSSHARSELPLASDDMDLDLAVDTANMARV